MSVATMTSKGQVTIPVDIRRLLDLHAGVRLQFTPLPTGGMTVQPRRASLTDLYGSLRAGNGVLPHCDDDERALGAALAEDDERIRREYRAGE